MWFLEMIIIGIIIAIVLFAIVFAIRFYYKILTNQDPFDFMNK